MKKRFLALFLALVMMLALLPNTASAAAVSPTASTNINKQDYISDHRWADTVKSYLYANSIGGLTRVEYTDSKVIVEDYDNMFRIQSSRTIQPELPIWGGFYAGEDYNFLIFGQSNAEEDNNKEIIRVVKYSKDWQRLGACSIKGANTCTPFMCGSLRCAEYNGYLYIHTCHQMYASKSDGINHQANMLLNIRESDMEWVSGEIGVGTSSDDYSYVSHSFNQFVLVDAEGHVITLNHGDGYPRGLALFRNYAKAGQDKLFQRMATAPWEPGYNKYGDSLLALKFSGSIGQNLTGVALGGFAETSSGYIIVYNYTSDYSNRYANRHLYMTYVDKETLGTSYWELTTGLDGNIGNPQLVPTGLDGGYIMWQNNIFNKKVYYAWYKSTGGIDGVNEASACNADLSDCAPIYWSGKVVWYVTNNSTPIFYTLDSSGVSAHTAGIGAAVTPVAHSNTVAVTIDGKKVEFQMYSLKDAKGNDTNYIKIRDLALALKGTKAQFDVGMVNGVITFTGGKDYAPNGSENSTPYSGQQPYTKKSGNISVNGTLYPIDAFEITYNRGGYTYFQLKDIAQKLNFNVAWRGSIVVETDKPYTGK